MRAGNRASSLRSLQSGAALLPLVLAVWALTILAAPAAAQRPPGPRVKDIELRTDAALGIDFDLRSLIAFVPGVRLTEPAVRRTLSNFYTTGRFAAVEIFTRSTTPVAGEADWVTAVVVARSHTWVETVEIAGEPGLKAARLREVLEQQPGVPLSEERLQRGLQALRGLYAERGYFEASVELEVDLEPGSSKLAHVVYRLASGPRVAIAAIHFLGDTGGFDDEELRGALRSRVGSPYDRERVATDRQRLRSFWARRGHPAAEVEPPRETYDPETRKIHLIFPVDAGPAIEVEVTGAERQALEKRGLLLFLRERRLDETLIAQSCEQIVDHFQARGHFRARAGYLVEEDGDHRRVRIDVERGPVYRLEKIRFEGNEQILTDDLLPLLSTSVRRRLRPGSGRLVPEDLEEDLDNLRSYYLLQGFSEAEVGPEFVYQDENRLELVIPICEGPRQRLVDLDFSGNQVLSQEELRRVLPLRSSGPFHPVLLEDSVNILRTLYEERGHSEVSVAPRLDWNDDRTLVDVHFEIYEGPQVLVDRVILRGYRHSRSEVMRRFIRLESGEPISRSKLLEVERDLYRLAIFSQVDVEVAPTSESIDRRDVIVRLEEGKRWRLAYGISYHSEDGIGGLFSLTRSNVGGCGGRLQLDVRGSGLDRRFRLLYDQPSFLRRNLPVTWSLFQQEEERESFTVEDLGAQVSLIKDFGSYRAGLVYEYRMVDLSEETIDPGDIARENRDLEISSLTPNFFIDRRDDPLDATRGWSTSLQLEYAFPFLSAEADFLKLFWQQTYYQPLGPLGLLAGSVRIGAIEPLDDQAEVDPTVPEGLASALVPVSERFFGGGRTSHRGFERDQLGIVGDTLLEREGGDFLELGGNGLFVVNLDYRFPIAGALGGTVFFDLGNVWSDWRNLDPDELEAGAGVGLRYRSPIGPVRIEIGWKLDSEFEEDSAVFFMSFGNPF